MQWYLCNALHYDIKMATALLGDWNFSTAFIILWDHRHVCGPSLTETSLCGA